MASFKSQLFTQVSGSVGGTTFSRNRGGMYIRARTIPTDPGTAPQLAARNALKIAVGEWTNTLTAANRTSWDIYALNTPVTSKLGDPINLSGQQMFVRSAAFALRIDPAQTTVPYSASGPIIFDLGDSGLVSFGDFNTATNVDVNFAAGEDWVDTDGSALGIFTSRQQNASKTFFKGPYQFAANVLGNSTTPPSSPAGVEMPFAVDNTQKLFGQARLFNSDGRLSTVVRFDVIVSGV